jgi:hypothetical protein
MMAGVGGGPGAGGIEPAPREPWVPSFETVTLNEEFVAEAAELGDIDGDGDVDFWAGPRWYSGPELALGGVVYEPVVVPIEEYSQHFISFLDDLDGDGDLDGLAYGFPGIDVRWYENPGNATSGSWPVHTVLSQGVGNESPTYADLDGDGQRELVFMLNGTLGYARRPADAKQPWPFTPISPNLGFSQFTHGLGVGDVDGDGKPDVVERTGVWLQRASGGNVTWEHDPHDFAQGQQGGAQMYVYDVDGDGDSDVITALAAHGYGLSWFEQTSASPLSFTAHEILPATPGPGNFSQLHALVLEDLNGDGLKDLITGKRFYAHPGTQDPGGTDPAVLYWFELKRTPNGVVFEPHLIHSDSGVGCAFVARDMNADGKPDIAVINKKGAFLHLQQ